MEIICRNIWQVLRTFSEISETEEIIYDSILSISFASMKNRVSRRQVVGRGAMFSGWLIAAYRIGCGSVTLILWHLLRRVACFGAGLDLRVITQNDGLMNLLMKFLMTFSATFKKKRKKEGENEENKSFRKWRPTSMF